MDGLISGGLKTGGGFNVGFYSMLNAISYLEYMAAHSMNFCRTGWALWLNWLSFFKEWICISCKMKNTQTLASALRRIVSLLNECIPKWILQTSTPVPRLLVNCRWSLLYGSVQIYWPAFFLGLCFINYWFRATVGNDFIWFDSDLFRWIFTRGGFTNSWNNRKNVMY